MKYWSQGLRIPWKFRERDHIAAKVPEERVQPGRTAHRIIDLNSAQHYREHGDQIRAWRAANSL